MMVEFPGYGRSEGSPSQEAITAVMQKAWDTLAARPEVDKQSIILMGRSIGAGATCQLAARRPSCAVILMSPFTSIKAFAPRYMAPPFLVRDSFDNLATIRSYREPLLVFHGTRDNIIPFRHGRTLADAAENGRLVSYDCGHNDMPTSTPRFWQEIDLFLRQACPNSGFQVAD